MVLVTGSAGRVGQAVVKELLAQKIPVVGFDRRVTSGLSNAFVGELKDLETLNNAFHGVSTLIHLAATPDDAPFKRDLLPDNIVGLHTVMECARDAEVKRIILASSSQVNHWQLEKQERTIKVDDPVTPYSWYASTKVFAESVGRSYAEMYGISVLVARLGWLPRDRTQCEELKDEAWGKDVYLSPEDAGRFFAATVLAPENLKYQVFYATSRPLDTERFDLGPAKALLGWEPKDQWPEGLGFRV
jgi:uronate dehydrogenase